MEALGWIISIVALGVSVAALVVALRGRRER